MGIAVSKRPVWMRDFPLRDDGREGPHERWWDCDECGEPSLCRGHYQIAAAAPALVRALLQSELAFDVDQSESTRHFCPACDETAPGHYAGCPLDAALTAAGFPDQASRDDARRLMREAK